VLLLRLNPYPVLVSNLFRFPNRCETRSMFRTVNGKPDRSLCAVDVTESTWHALLRTFLPMETLPWAIAPNQSRRRGVVCQHSIFCHYSATRISPLASSTTPRVPIECSTSSAIPSLMLREREIEALQDLVADYTSLHMAPPGSALRLPFNAAKASLPD
jgi:hypothetical protein